MARPSLSKGQFSIVLTVRTIVELRAAIAAFRAEGARIALVPTMGAVHAGHMALVEAAKRPGTKVVASIFVNPKQFGANEDLGRYPRKELADTRMLNEAGCDLLWMPPVEVVYPEGVATVVTKLFNQVAPDIAYFGEKDFQQLAVIRRMVTDLDMAIEIVGVPTPRDDDGLSQSSRNVYLDDAQRTKAVALPRALGVAAKVIGQGGDPEAALATARDTLTAAGFDIDYVTLVDADTLTEQPDPARERRLLAAARMGSTRLIGNIAIPAKHGCTRKP